MALFLRAGNGKIALHLFLVLMSTNVLLQLLFFVTLDHTESSVLRVLRMFFHLNTEKNVPSTYSAFQLVLASFSAVLCFKFQRNDTESFKHARYTWLGVAMILFYMSLDEYFSFHEDLGTMLGKSNIIPSEFLNEFTQYGYAWTIVGGG